MKYDYEKLNNKLNTINEKKDVLNEEFKQCINHVAHIDETNMTKDLKCGLKFKKFTWRNKFEYTKIM